MKKIEDKKSHLEINKLEQKIINGEYGGSGEVFMTTRELAIHLNVALVTAQKILTALKEKGLVELYKKKNYLTYDKVLSNSPFGKQKTQKSGLIGMHVTNLESPYFSALARAVEVCLNSMGYRVLITSSGYNHVEEREILKMFRSIGVDGIISSPGVSDETSEIYRRCTLPCVFLGRYLSGVNISSVLANNHPAARRIAKHFINEGFQNFAYIGQKEVKRAEDLRLMGFSEGLSKEGFALREQDILNVNLSKIDEAKSKIKRFIRQFEAPTAIFCFHDLLAIEVLKCCTENKIKVPEEIAVAGFDNLPVSQNIVPNLTTAGYRLNEMADMAAHLLIKQINGEDHSSARYYVEPMLIIRESTSPKKEKIIKPIETNELLYKI